jgi:hypothetical protein
MFTHFLVFHQSVNHLLVLIRSIFKRPRFGTIRIIISRFFILLFHERRIAVSTDNEIGGHNGTSSRPVIGMLFVLEHHHADEKGHKGKGKHQHGRHPQFLAGISILFVP